MNDKDLLISGTGYAAWGYFFLYFDFNLGNISILPSFVGMILFLNAIKTLKGLRREMGLLEGLGRLILLWDLAQWLLAWAGITLEGQFPPLGLIITVASIYFHFQLLTDFAALARQYLPELPLSEKMLRWRSVQTVLITIMHLTTYSSRFESEWMQWIVLAMALVYLFAGFLLMMELFNLRRKFRNLDADTAEQ